MEDQKIISGDTEQDVWAVIEKDLATGEDILYYNALIKQGNKEIELYIDIDPGGGFESGWETTQLRAVLSVSPDFRFAIHDEDFLDEVGKFFGMQDVETGFTDLDKHVIIKTNDEQKVREAFADSSVRQFFASLDDFDFGIHMQKVEDSDAERPVLELNINEGVTDPVSLRQIYHAFYVVLNAIEG